MIKASLISISAALVAAAALGGASVVACSSSSSNGTGDGGTGGDTGTGGDSNVKTDSPTGGDSSPTGDSAPPGDGGTDSPVGPAFFAYVAAAASPPAAMGAPGTFSLSAFGSTSMSIIPGQGGCTGGMMAGSCCYQPAAPPPDGGAGDGGAPASPQMGVVTVSGLADAGAVTLTPDTAGTYMATPMTGYSWNPGDSLMVMAAGDPASIHSFSGTLVTGALFSNLMPALSFVTPTMVTAGMDFVISWTMEGMAGEKALMIMTASNAAMASDGTITCSVDESTGMITVMSALLGNFPAGDTGIIILERGIPKTPTTPADNATVYLIGGASEIGRAAY